MMTWPCHLVTQLVRSIFAFSARQGPQAISLTSANGGAIASTDTSGGAILDGVTVSAGADIVQIDEPYMQARPEKAREYGIQALNVALDRVAGETAVHICFGYAAIIHERPEGYSFLPELAQCSAHSISIETAQSELDCVVLEELPEKKIILGVLDLSTNEVETAETVAAQIRRALPHCAAERIVVAPDCGLKYLSRDAALGKIKSMVDGAAIVREELK